MIPAASPGVRVLFFVSVMQAVQWLTFAFFGAKDRTPSAMPLGGSDGPAGEFEEDLAFCDSDSLLGSSDDDMEDHEEASLENDDSAEDENAASGRHTVPPTQPAPEAATLASNTTDPNEELPQHAQGSATGPWPVLSLASQEGKKYILVFLDIEIRHPNRFFGSAASIGYTICSGHVRKGQMVPSTVSPSTPDVRRHAFIKPPPGCPEHPACIAIHKISEASLQAGDTFDVVMQCLQDHVSSAVQRDGGPAAVAGVLFIAHNGTAYVVFTAVCDVLMLPTYNDETHRHGVRFFNASFNARPSFESRLPQPNRERSGTNCYISTPQKSKAHTMVLM